MKGFGEELGKIALDGGGIGDLENVDVSIWGGGHDFLEAGERGWAIEEEITGEAFAGDGDHEEGDAGAEADLSFCRGQGEGADALGGFHKGVE